VKISKNEIDVVDIPQPFRTTQISEIVCMHGWTDGVKQNMVPVIFSVFE